MPFFGQSWDDPQTAAMLALGAGLMGTRGSFGEGLAAGTQGAMQAYRQSQSAAAERQEREQMRQMREMQMEEARRQAAAAQAAAERQARAGSIMSGAFRPQTDAGSFMQNMTGGDYVTPSQSAMPDMAMGLKQAQQAMMAQGMVPEAIALQEQIAKLAPKLEKVGSGDRMFDPVAGKVVLDALPDLIEMNLGGSTVLADKRDPNNAGKSFKRTMTPGEAASNALGWANYNQAGQRLSFDKEKDRRDALQSVTVDGQPYTFDKRTGQYSQGRDAAGNNIVQDKMKRDAGGVLDMINQAVPLIEKSTGSWAGAGIDQVARAFGSATDGAVAIGQLKALEGALIAKMPRMEGPQSNADALLYRQAVGQIADPTVPQETRMAALEVVRSIQERYAGMGQGMSKPRNGFDGKPIQTNFGSSSSGGWSVTEIK